MAPHSSTPAWKIPWMEEPGRLQSMGSLRVRHDWATSLSLFTFMHWRKKWQPTRVLAWRIPGTGQPGGLLSMGSHRVGHNWSDLTAAAGSYLEAFYMQCCFCFLNMHLFTKWGLLSPRNKFMLFFTSIQEWKLINVKYIILKRIFFCNSYLLLPERGQSSNNK